MVEAMSAVTLHGFFTDTRSSGPMSASTNFTPRPRDAKGRLLPVPAVDRFWAKVNKTATCWLWTASCSSEGYGRINISGKSTYAHRWAYEQAHGPIPEGMHIDHLCRVRHCVNPEHMEVVTNRQNFTRGEHPNAKLHRSGHCKRGHPLTGSNVLVRQNGTRHCRACSRERWHERKKE